MSTLNCNLRRIAAALLAPAVLALGACGDDAVRPPDPGSIEVTVTASGQGADPDGFSVRLDGANAKAIAATGGTASFDPVPAGDHTVDIVGVAANCTVDGGNTKTVTVASGQAATASFTVTCTAQGPAETGSIEVSVATTGASADIDPDGYTVSVDAGVPDTVAVNDTLTIAGLPAGDHVVQLGGVAVNCTVSPAATDTVTVVANDTVTSAFDIACAEPPAATGAIRALTTTTGDAADIDPDGYTVTVDAGTPDSIGVNDTLVVANLPTGDHDVTLGDLAANCTVSGTNPLTVTVAENDTIDAAFTVDCAATGGGGLTGQIAFHSDRDGGDLDILIINADGTGLDTLTEDAATPADDQLPAISPDGTKIAFISDRGGSNDVWTMNVDGTSPFRVTNVTASELAPQWSPDGLRIVFVRQTGAGGLDLFIVNAANGTGLTRLTQTPEDEENPDWSPDGNQIAFGAEIVESPDDPATDSDIYVLDVAAASATTITDLATGATNLTDATAAGDLRDSRPEFSPDGTRIVWDTNRDGASAQVYVMNADGTTKVRLTNAAPTATEFAPTWSPDGSFIAFGSEGRGGQAAGDIFIMPASGDADPLQVTRRTTDPAKDVQPDWGQ